MVLGETNMNALLTIQDVATALRVSRTTADRLVRTGAISSVVVVEGPSRRLVRIPHDALEAYLTRLERGSSGRTRPTRT